MRFASLSPHVLRMSLHLASGTWRSFSYFHNQSCLSLLPYHCAHFTRYQGYTQNPLRQALAVCELRTSRCTSWVLKRQRNQRSNCQHLLDQRKQGNSRKTFTSASLTILKPLTVWIKTNCGKFLKEMGVPDHLTCLLRNLYADQEAIVRTLYGTWNNWLAQD